MKMKMAGDCSPASRAGLRATIRPFVRVTPRIDAASISRHYKCRRAGYRHARQY